MHFVRIHRRALVAVDRVCEITALANGDAAVIALSAVREEPGDPQQQDMMLRRQFAAQIASGEAQSYAAGARADAKVTLNPQAIE